MPDVVTHRDLEYAVADGIPLRLDLYLPAEPPGPLPVLLWVHGGGWRAGDKAEIAPGWGETWVGKGYAAASVNYRLSGQAPFPAPLYDCKAAVRWLRAHAGEYSLDPERIGAWGSSAGGHLVALLGVTTEMAELEGDLGNPEESSEVQAVCAWMAPTHILSMAALQEEMGAPGGVLYDLLGGPPEEREELARLASPVHHVSGDEPPFLICHGDRDRTVPFQQALTLYEALRKAGDEVELYTFKGAAHGRGPFFANADLMARVEAFFRQHLNP
jgi:acetyl esterase/lipase